MTTVKRQRKLKWNKASYRDLVTFKLPRNLRGGKVKGKASWNRKTSRSPESARNLYPVKVLQKKGDKIKVHYIGYDKKYDEWKNQCDIETITDNVTSKVTSDVANQQVLSSVSFPELADPVYPSGQAIRQFSV